MKKLVFLFFIIASSNLFGQENTFKWVKKIPFDIVTQCTDNNDNIYIAGIFTDTIQLDDQTIIDIDGKYGHELIAKFDSSGNLIWYKQFGGSLGLFVADMKMDHNNNLIVLNYFNDSTIYYGDTITTGGNRHGAILAKLTNNGDLVWYEVPGYNENGCFHAFTTAIDGDNNILINGDIQYGNGIFGDTIIPSFGDIPGFVAKYNTDGDFLWVRKLYNITYQCTFDHSNNVLIFQDTIQKYSTSDDSLWLKRTNIDFRTTPSVFWPKVVLDSLNNFYIAARMDSTFICGNDSIVTSKYSRYLYVKCDATGTPVFGAEYTSQYDGPNSISIYNNKILIAGNFMNKLYYSNDSLVALLKYRVCIFVCEYDLAGNLKFMKKIDNKVGCLSELISAGKSIYLSGYVRDTTYFDNILFVPGPTVSTMSYFLARMQSEVNVQPIIYPETFEIFPNPTKSSLTINFNPSYKNVSLTIYDLQGKLIMQKDLNNYSNTINIEFLSNGLYIAKMKTDESTMYKKIEKF